MACDYGADRWLPLIHYAAARGLTESTLCTCRGAGVRSGFALGVKQPRAYAV